MSPRPTLGLQVLSIGSEPGRQESSGKVTGLSQVQGYVWCQLGFPNTTSRVPGDIGLGVWDRVICSQVPSRLESFEDWPQAYRLWLSPLTPGHGYRTGCQKDVSSALMAFMPVSPDHDYCVSRFLSFLRISQAASETSQKDPTLPVDTELGVSMVRCC